MKNIEKDTPLSTNRLFHYTSSLDNLISILQGGLKVFYSLEQNYLFDSSQPEYVTEFAVPIVCFCDIPLTLVGKHTELYGQFAIGLTKEWGEKQAVCPVLYLPPHGETTFLFKNMIMNQIRIDSPSLKQRLSKAVEMGEFQLILDIRLFYGSFSRLALFTKPYIGEYKVDKENKNFYEKNYKFYDEREWRYIPPAELLARQTITKAEYDHYRSKPFEDKVLGWIGFEPEDITDIVVPYASVEEAKTKIRLIEKFANFDFGKVHPL